MLTDRVAIALEQHMFLPFLPLLAIGVILGFEHTLEADHIVAVITLTSHTKSVRRAVFLGATWGLGHAVILIAVSFIILITRVVIPERLALLLEMAVGVLLIGLGIDTVWKALKGELRFRVHEHDGVTHAHLHSTGQSHDHHTRRSFLSGIIQGLAGSAAMVLLVVSTFASVIDGLVFIACFGLGLIVGIALITILLTAPFKLTVKTERLNQMMRVAAGALSLIVGLALIYQIGFVQGLLLHGV